MNLEENEEEKSRQVNEEGGLPVVDWLKKQYQHYRKFTQRSIADSV